MVDAKKCDRCGKFYIDNTETIEKILDSIKCYFGVDDTEPQKFINHVCTNYDLCKDCKHSLLIWFKMGKEPAPKKEVSDE